MMRGPGATDSSPASMTLLLEGGHIQRLRRWARAGYPEEVCGLLLGRKHGGRRKVTEVRRAPNLADDRIHDRYELDPGALLEADRDARAAGLEILGVWHTHPDHPARPSETDLALAWERYAYLILSVSQARVVEMRTWTLIGDRFVEGRIETWQEA